MISIVVRSSMGFIKQNNVMKNIAEVSYENGLETRALPRTILKRAYSFYAVLYEIMTLKSFPDGKTLQ